VGTIQQKKTETRLTGINNNLLLEHTFKRLHAPLFFYAHKFVKNEEAAKDLVQDAFLSILNKKADDPEIENLKSYLYRAVRNNCLNYLNHKTIEHDFEEQEIERSKREMEYYDIHKTLVEKELQQKITEAVNSLPESYRLPFVMSRFGEMKNKEIAEKLEIPVRTVETKIYRALNLLREKLENQMLSLFAFFISR